MIVILPTLPNPAPVIILEPPKATTKPVQSGDALAPMMMNDMSSLSPLSPWLPSDSSGPHSWYGIRPRQIGPMAYFGGVVAMLDIGPQVLVSPDVDPIQTWLYSKVPQDLTGEFVYMNDEVGGPSAYPTDSIVAGDHVDGLGISSPRTEILNSGLMKQITAPTLPADYGFHMIPVMSTNIRYYLTGTTRDNAGTALASCAVTALLMSALQTDAAHTAYPIAGTATSDGAGAFSMQVDKFGNHQLISYKAGGTDVAGITKNNVTPTPG